jgi:hypothetical protein
MRKKTNIFRETLYPTDDENVGDNAAHYRAM